MYLSKIELDYWQTRNPYSIHSCLWSLFPGLKREIDWLTALDGLSSDNSTLEASTKGNIPGNIKISIKEDIKNSINRPFLFRVEKEATKEKPAQILIQSEIEPIQSDFVGIKLVVSKEFNLNLREGQTLRFALCANPVRFSKETQGHIALTREEEQIKWLIRKLSDSAQLLEIHIKSAKDVYFKKKIPEGELIGKIFLANFVGILLVKDPLSLIDNITKGIGRGKAFGGGLLTLARYS